ncbi:MAG: molybdenum cofactor guanylyltransferase [Chitinophagaceae bacterium]
MTGVILCGGQSTRMGTDKGMLKLQAGTWAQTAVDKMAALPLPVMLSVNEEQYDAYSAVFKSDLLVKDNETIDVKGPLRGVLSVHAQDPAANLFILACDMPLMEASVLKQLLNFCENQDGDAFVFTNDGAYEPLCGIYTARALARILHLQKTKQLAKYSMKYVLEQLTTISIALNEDQKKYFRNFNAHAELNGL